jgi:hypothetical protein
MTNYKALRVLGVLAALIALPGCGAVMLNTQADFATTIQRLSGDVDAAAQAALDAAARRDGDALSAAHGTLLRSCGRLDRYVDGAEAAVRSYYGQQNSLAAIAAAEQATYQRNCKVDGLDRLAEETESLRHSARFLNEACSCHIDLANPGGTRVDFRDCNVEEAVWDDYWERHEHDAQFLANATLWGLSTGYLLPILIADGLNTLFGGTVDRYEACGEAYQTYWRRFDTVTQVASYCATPPTPAPDGAPLTREALNAAVARALEQAGQGIGETRDGTGLLVQALAAQSQCTDVLAGLNQVFDSQDDWLADVDTKPDLEPGDRESDYEIPEYNEPTPPRGE